MNRFNLDDRFDRVLNRLAKWRTVFASWQLGTRLTFGDGELAAVKEHHEATLLGRVELDTLIALLHDAKVIDPQELKFIEGDGKADPETTAVKTHRAETLRIRVELNALTKLLLDRGTFTVETSSGCSPVPRRVIMACICICLSGLRRCESMGSRREA